MENAINAVRCISCFAAVVCVVYEAYKRALSEVSRRWWVRPVNLSRDRHGFFETCMRQLQVIDEEHFFKALRMDVSNFNCLLELLKLRLQRTSWRPAISPEIRLSLTLLFLAQGCNLQILAWTHKIGISTVRKIIYETCDAIWDVLKDVYMSVPNATDFTNNANLFYAKTGMPNCLGAIDGKHINILRPKNSGSLYFNYKKHFSIVLLAACDANYTFTFVDVGALGSQSDGGIFIRSAFGKQILDGTLDVPPERYLPDGSRMFHYYFVADSAFPLKPNIMRPYPGQNLTADKDIFNKSMSRARVYIENAFGILANRWRILQTTIRASPENADKIVLATVLLHNFLMLKKDVHYFNTDLVDENENGVEGHWRAETNPLRSVHFTTPNRSTAAAFHIRNVLKDFLCNNIYG